MNPIKIHLKKKILSFFILFSLISSALLVIIFCIQIKIATDKSLAIVLAGVQNHVRVLSETAHNGYPEFLGPLLDAVAQTYGVDKIEILEKKPEEISKSSFFSPYQIQKFTICWRGNGIIEAFKKLEFLQTKKYMKITLNMIYFNSEILISLISILVFILFSFILLGIVFIKTVSDEIVVPIIKINKVLVDGENCQYDGSLQELSNLAKAIALSKKKIFEHITWETLRWVSHDIKGHVLSVVKFAKRLPTLEGVEAQIYCEENYPLLLKNMESINSTIDDLQDAGIEPKLNLTVVSISDIIEEIDQTYREKVRVITADISLRYLTIDRNKFLRVLKNILNNAIEACPDSSHIVEMEVVFESKNVRFSVFNTGSSLSRSIITKLLHEFYCSRKKGGRGIGLSIVKRLTEAHGGTVMIESNGFNSQGEAVPWKTDQNYVAFDVFLPIKL